MDASGKNKRVTMIKSVVGKVKSAQYALPDIVYGVESKLDKEGAGKGEISLRTRFYCVSVFTVLSYINVRFLNSHHVMPFFISYH